MRKRIAALLSIVMIISLFSPFQFDVYATQASGVMARNSSDNFNLQEKTTQLPENLNNFTGYNVNLGSVWSGVTWEYERGETFYVTYYVEDSDGLTKVQHTIITWGSGEYEIKTQMWNAEGVEEFLSYRMYQTNTGSYSSASGFGDTPAIVETVNMETAFNGDKGNVVEIVSTTTNPALSTVDASKLLFRYYFEETTGDNGTTGKVHFTTNGVSAGNVMNFTVTGPGGATDTLEVLNAIDNFEGSATHYILDSFGELNELLAINYPNRVGDRPGMDVYFKQPLYVFENTQADGSFTLEYGDYELADNEVMRLQLESYTAGSTSIEIEFDMSKRNEPGSARLTRTDDYGTLYYDEDTRVYTIKIVQDQTIYNEDKTDWLDMDDEFIEWEDLQSSELMETAKIRILESGILKSEYPMENRLYTYLEYEIQRISETWAEIQYVGYRNISGEVTYNVYYNNVLEATATDAVSDRIAVRFSAGSDMNQYEVHVSLGDTDTLNSQKMIYNASTDNNIPPPTPQLEAINNIYVIPAINDQDVDIYAQPQAVGFDIQWSAPVSTQNNPELETLLEKGELYYEMFLYDDADTTQGEGEKIFSKVFKVSYDNDEVVLVEAFLGDADPVGSYSALGNSFSMTNVVLKPHESDGNWNMLVPDSGSDFINDNYLIDVTVRDYPNSATEQIALNYFVPNTYYVTMRAVYDKFDDEEMLSVSEESNPLAVTFNLIEEVVPVVSAIIDSEIQDEETIQHQVSFGVVDISSYVDTMLSPAGWELSNEDERTYEIFFATSDIMDTNGAIGTAEDEEIETIATAYNYDIVMDASGSIDMLEEGFLERLREGKMITIAFVDDDNTTPIASQPTILFQNLDPNQVYFLRIRTKLEAQHEDYDSQIIYSEISKEHSFTTYTKPLSPSLEEQAPPAPPNFTSSDTSSTTVTVSWEPPNYVVDTDEAMYYEIVRSKTNLIPDELLEIGVTLETILKSDEDYYAFTTEETYVNSLYWDGSEIIQEELDPQQLSFGRQILDNTLKPNTLYYYYLRTVITVDGQPIGSEWIYIPVTSQPIESPINLQVELTSDYSYNAKREVVITFDAPLPDGAIIPDEYDFEIAIQGESDTDYSIAGSTDSKYGLVKMEVNEEDLEDVPAGYQKLAYKITHLSSSSRYDIKVRTVDYTIEIEEGESAPRSLYSDKVIYRTEYDEAEELDNQALEDYLAKYDNLVNELMSQAYWIIEDGNGSTTYKYKENYFKADLAIVNLYDLEANPESTNFEYYFPISTFDWATDTNTTIRWEYDPFTMSIRPDTLDNYVDEIKDVLTKLSQREINDAYIKLDISIEEGENIGTDAYLTPKLNINLRVAESDDDDYYVEEDITDSLTSLNTVARENLVAGLEKELERDIIDYTALQTWVDTTYAQLVEDHREEMQTIMDVAIHDTTKIKTLNNSILLQANIDSNNVTGYYAFREWEEIYVFKVGGGYALEIVEMGTYIFVGQKTTGIEIPTLPSNVTHIVQVYQLGTIFDLSDTSAKATKQQMLDSIARMLGAPTGADAITYLQQKGFTGIMRTGLTNPIEQGDAIFVAMQLYEKTYFKSVDSIFIANRQGISNIGAFPATYRTYVYAAVELGVVELNNGQVFPNEQLSVIDALEILANVMP
ncbi:MAG: hypothetical protein ATN35_11095 [Epulopiscium sp. Nele67-Bin004]|nr:MAG: hypothetical protein ATN35_11095 [Epulopiscium sp. Nele67-Bin004]